MSRPLIARRLSRFPKTGMQRFFELAASGGDLLSLGVGEPDFTTPEPILEAGAASLARRETSYTATTGLPRLRAAVAAHLERLYGVSYDPAAEIVITVGVSEGIAAALAAVIDPGDEVIVPQPSFLSYVPAVLLAGGEPVVVETRPEDGFRPTAAALQAAVTPRTKALLVNYPNNPTGAVLDEGAAAALARVAEEHDLAVISDEIYDRLVYGAPHVCLAARPGMGRRTVLLGGFSKAYAMTGWRLGWAAAPGEIAAGLIETHQATVMCPPTTAQHAGLVALESGEEAVAEMRREYDRRRRLLVTGLARLGLPCAEPGGAFYVFPSIAGTGLSDLDFAERLLAEEKVFVLPGSAFGEAGRGFIRCSYATSLEALEEALARLEGFLERLAVPTAQAGGSLA